MSVRIFRLLPFTIVWLLLTGVSTHAQWTMGGRNIALGQAHTALPGDSWAIFHNPALISHSRKMTGFFAIRYYGLKELEDHAVFVSTPIPISSGAFSTALAAGAHSYGFELYRETQIRIGGSIRYEGIRAGLAAKYVHLRIHDFGSHGAVLFDAGLAVSLLESLTIGFRQVHLLHNGLSFRTTGSENNAHYPAEMAAGVSWQAIPPLLVTADVVKDVMFPLAIRTGVEAEIMNGVFLRGGWTSRPFTWSAGAGFQISRIETALTVQNHEVLGLSPGIDCTISF